MEKGPSRKRVKRTTKSCYQCRSRKVKCSLTEKPVDTCAECVKTSTRCTTEAPAATSTDGGPDGQSANEDHGQRLDRIESLLKKLVESQENPHVTGIPMENGGDNQLAMSMTSSSLDDPFFGALPSIAGSTDTLSSRQAANNMVRFGASSTSGSYGKPASPPLPPAMANGLATTQTIEWCDYNQSLVALLPSPQDAVTIVMYTLAWLWGAETPSGSVLRPDDTIQLMDLDAISQGRPTQVAKMLLLFALYMQQLPSDFDESLLGFEDVDQATESMVDRAKAFIMTHEDQASSLEGLECLLLLSTIYLNSGDIRKTWATFRRTLDMARLAGLQDSFSASKRDSTTFEDAFRRRLWLSAVSGDCYCSLLLGQMPSFELQPFGPSHEKWVDPVAEKEANIQRRICAIMAAVARRNADGGAHDLELTYKLGLLMGRLDETMPTVWWDTPLFPADRSLDSAQEPNRLICQMWFYQTLTFIRFPEAFGPINTSSEKRATESLTECVDCSRAILQRHIASQHAKDQLSRCRGGEQATFLAAVVLLLTVVHRRLRSIVKEESINFSLKSMGRQLIEDAIDSFESRGRQGRRERISKQCADILSTMRDLAFSEDFFAQSAAYVHRDIGAKETEMESLINTAIRPSLYKKGPALRLIELAFAKMSGPD